MMKWLSILLLFVCSLAWAGLNLPYPFYSVQKGLSNELTLINRPEEALQTRIDMIRAARKNIAVEYFIYDTDIVGKIITRELVAAAKRGVKVRILVDAICLKNGLKPAYAHELAKYGIEVKYYNHVSLLRISSAQFRDHRKLISVDDEVAITGGRNIGMHYYNLADSINYDDRDILVKGPIVKVMRESFDNYFNHKIAQPAKKTKKDDPKAVAFLKETEEERKVREAIETTARRQMEINRPHVCEETTYATDRPGARAGDRLNIFTYRKKFRFLRQVLHEKMNAATKQILIDSPYWIANKSFKKVITNALKRGVAVSVHTNSLASTDALFMSANLYLHFKSWIKKGLNIYLHDGKRTETREDFISGTTPKLFGNHAKSHVYEYDDSSEIMVGSYNIDNRSDFYNNELAIFCKGNEDLSQELKQDILDRSAQGIMVQSSDKALTRDGRTINVTGDVDKKKRDLMRILYLPGWMIDFLL
jgi:putative cardiolipin synthase